MQKHWVSVIFGVIIKYTDIFIQTLDANIQDVRDSDVPLHDNLNSTDAVVSKMGYETETICEDAKPSSNRNRSKRKRDNPLVLADDDLIRNWCQMKCTKCPDSFNGFTFKDVKIHYSKEHGTNGFLLCCHKKFFRRVRALEHIARHINPREFR